MKLVVVLFLLCTIYLKTANMCKVKINAIEALNKIVSSDECFHSNI